MKKQLMLTLCVFTLAIVGCGEPKQKQAKEMSDDNPFNTYKKSHNKAKGVEQTLLNADQKRRQEQDNY